MDIKKKFRDMWRKVKGEKTAKKTAPRRAPVDAEISVEEVTREEIFPEGKRRVTVNAAAKPQKPQPPSRRQKRKSRSPSAPARPIPIIK